MIAGSVLMVIGSATLNACLKVNSSTATWVGLQILVSAGSGFLPQQTQVAVQAVVPPKDIPVATALIVFCQTLGASVFLAVSQAVFDSTLVSRLAAVLPNGINGTDLASLTSSGEADLASLVPASLSSAVLEAYDDAVTMPFIGAAAMGGAALLASFGMEWVSVKGRDLMGGGSEAGWRDVRGP